MKELSPEAKAFLQRLKEETDTAHTLLEDNELSKRIVSADVTVAEYATYLSRMLPLHQAIEEQLFPQLKNIFQDIDERKKADLIRKDLEQLPPTSVRSKAFTADLSFTNSLPGALGMMYVMEGSALGGKVILKQLQKTLPEEVFKNATHYFSVYGDQIGKMWMRFLNNFSDAVIANKMEDEVINGAKNSFEQIRLWFDN